MENIPSFMGRKNYDRWMSEDWRRVAPHVGAMRQFNWSILSFCRSCHLTMEVDLELVEKVKGPNYALWNQQSTCKRLGCRGVVEFQAKPPEIANYPYFRLFAEWVE